jgi:hypothetical protein
MRICVVADKTDQAAADVRPVFKRNSSRYPTVSDPNGYGNSNPPPDRSEAAFGTSCKKRGKEARQKNRLLSGYEHGNKTNWFFISHKVSGRFGFPRP